ncbi:MAG TPA: hypothetical protein GXZ26_07150 [Firmicutes bacterium]|jgi:hypothetical protein|nr:hypothetical protein [Bacillota bacterium]
MKERFYISPEKKERVALSFLAVVQLWALWARSYLYPLLFFTHFTWDYSLRLLFFLLIYTGRYHIFREYRRPGILAAAFMTGFAGPFSFYLIFSRPPGEEWYLAGLALIDYAVLAVYYGIIIEFVVAITGELWKKEKPFGCDLTLPGQRFFAAEKGVTTHVRLTLYLIPLLCLALYALHTRYLFDWIFYSHAAVILLLLFFFWPLLRLQARLREAAAPERQVIAEKLNRLYLRSCAASSLPPSSAAGCCEEIITLCIYHDFLLSSAALPWRWDNLLPLIGGFLFLFSQPALARLFLTS